MQIIDRFPFVWFFLIPWLLQFWTKWGEQQNSEGREGGKWSTAALRSEQLENTGYSWSRMQEDLVAVPRGAWSPPQTSSNLPVLGWIASQSLGKKDWKHHVTAGSLAMGILIWKGPTRSNCTLLQVPCAPDSAQSCNCRVTRDRKEHKALHWHPTMSCLHHLEELFRQKCPEIWKSKVCPKVLRRTKKTQPDCSRSAMLIRERNALLTLQMTNRQSETWD